MRKSATAQTENAFSAFLAGQATGDLLSPLSFYSAQGGYFTGTAFTWMSGATPPQPLTMKLPNVTVQATSPAQYGYDSGKYDLSLKVGVMTQVDDTAILDEGLAIHRQRVEALRDILEAFDAATSPLNWTAGDTDPRVVQNIAVSSIVYDGEAESETDRHIVTDITYSVTVGII